MKRLSAALTFFLVLGVALAGQVRQGPWVGVWAAAATARPVPAAAPTSTGAAPSTPIQFQNQTLRQVVRISAAGEAVRVVFSNAFGTTPIEIGAASLAIRDKDAAIVAGSSQPLRFAGEATGMIPAGAILMSDAVELRVEPFTDLAIDLFLPGDTATSPSPLSVHPVGLQTGYVSGTGNHAGTVAFTPITTLPSWYLLARVEVVGAANAAAIVTVGDSITDGTRSTPNTNNRWPDELARRLQADPSMRHLSVVNAGISGNRLISELNPGMGINLLARFDRDVLAVPGVRYVVLLEGINDIGMRGQTTGPTAAALIAAHRQAIERAHAKGLKIIGATLLPFEGAAYFTADGEAKRQAVNEWIRTGRAYDAVIDFDAVMRDPQQPSRMLAAYDSGDHLHPNDAGYKAMGQAVDLRIFK